MKCEHCGTEITQDPDRCRYWERIGLAVAHTPERCRDTLSAQLAAERAKSAGLERVAEQDETEYSALAGRLLADLRKQLDTALAAQKAAEERLVLANAVIVAARARLEVWTRETYDALIGALRMYDAPQAPAAELHIVEKDLLFERHGNVAWFQYLPTGTWSACGEHESFLKNKAQALRELREKLAPAAEPVVCDCGGSQDGDRHEDWCAGAIAEGGGE